MIFGWKYMLYLVEGWLDLRDSKCELNMIFFCREELLIIFGVSLFMKILRGIMIIIELIL